MTTFSEVRGPKFTKLSGPHFETKQHIGTKVPRLFSPNLVQLDLSPRTIRS